MTDILPFSLSDAKRWNNIYPTPFYIYDEEGIKNCVTELYRAFSWNKGFKEYFAVKATPTPGILRLLHSLGCGADCASVTELMLAERCGMTGHDIMFSSNETLDEEYKACIKLGGIVNLDDFTQIENLKNAAGIPETVCCRYNPGEFCITNDIIGHLHDSKFGMTKKQLFEAYSELKRLGVKHFGLHAMLASCSIDNDYYPGLAEEMFNLILEIKEQLGVAIEFADMSGGIGIPYRPEDKAIDIARVGDGVHRVYDEILGKRGIDIKIFTEMGRYITGPYGYLVTKAVGFKHIYKEYVGVDATACDLMRPAMYGAYHHITVLGKESAAKNKTYDIVGSLCENNDKFAVDRSLPEIEKGDLLVIQDCGAHGHSMGYNYNGKLKCAELMMDNKKDVTLIRRAETACDYFSTLDVDEAFMSAGSIL